MKPVIIFIVLIVLALGLYLWIQGGDQNVAPNPQPVSISGEVTCLPHRDTSGPVTLECALGLMDEEGDHYALNTALMSQTFDPSTTGRITVSGRLVPYDDIDGADRLRIYDIEGVIYVTEVSTEEEMDETTIDTHVMPGEQIAFVRLSDFALAVNADQMPNGVSIPPCDADFDYCLYYNDDTYQGTNFVSAGVRLDRRGDLAAGDECLLTQPTGYQGLIPVTEELSTYSTSRFTPIQDAATGHFASGELYRLSFEGNCYEFETRLAESRFELYEPGTINEFGPDDEAAMLVRLRSQLAEIRLNGEDQQSIFGSQ